MPTSSLVPHRLLQDATDTDLRQLIYSQECVLVKYVDDDCTVCKTLAPHLEQFANDPRYAHILFLRLNAAENPVAVREVEFTKAPFVAAYRNGRLMHCETVLTEQRVEKILQEYLLPG